MKVTLLYAPNQSWPETMCKPNGSLAFPYIAAVLLEKDIEVKIFDACVGNEKDSLEKCFFQSTPLPSGLLRTGVSNDRILEEISDSDVIGLTSIFTDQESMVLATARLIKRNFPEKVIIAGGNNARSRMEHFFEAGVDLIFLSEVEQVLPKALDIIQKGSLDFDDLSSVAFKNSNGKLVIIPTKPEDIITNLDELPIPAWHHLPNERYWTIRRPHGGHFSPGDNLHYASMMTSRGCVFSCKYCHIGGEIKGSLSGHIGRFRIKSDERVFQELAVLQKLGVKQIFLEDDTFFGHKKRAVRILNKMCSGDIQVLDVNGLNVSHLLDRGEPDEEVLQALMSAGFREIALAFESGSQRILQKYASNKWHIGKDNIAGLISRCNDLGLTVIGSYMIGYPDETREEIETTIELARTHRNDGLSSVNFFIVIPLPGTPIYEIALKNGNLEHFDPDRMTWNRASMVNTAIPPEELEVIRKRAWEELNDFSFVQYKKAMCV